MSIDSHPRAKVSFLQILHTLLFCNFLVLNIAYVAEFMSPFNFPRYRRNVLGNRLHSNYCCIYELLTTNPHPFVASVAAVERACHQAAPSSGGIFCDTARISCGTSRIFVARHRQASGTKVRRRSLVCSVAGARDLNHRRVVPLGQPVCLGALPRRAPVLGAFAPSWARLPRLGRVCPV